MGSRLRIRRIAKWSGASISILILAAWTFSIFYFVSLPICGWDDEFQQYMHGFSLRTSRHSIELIGPGIVHRFPFEQWVFRRNPDYYSSARPIIEGWTVNPGAPGSSEGLWAWRVVIPFWLLLLCIAFPAALMFFRDRRHCQPGHCFHCGYNLTGNTSGICSECATKRPADESPAAAG